MVYADDGWSSWGDWLDSGTICYLQGRIPTIRAGACLRSHFGLKVVGRLVRLRQVRQTSKRYTHQARKNVRKTRRDLCLSTERYAKPRTRTAPSTAASTCRAAA